VGNSIRARFSWPHEFKIIVGYCRRHSNRASARLDDRLTAVHFFFFGPHSLTVMLTITDYLFVSYTPSVETKHQAAHPAADDNSKAPFSINYSFTITSNA
jgi:hypothetical protein